MHLLIFILIVIVVLALCMWLVYYLPFPPGAPPWGKNFLYVLLLLVAIIVIVMHAGIVNAQQPTPLPKQTRNEAQPLPPVKYRPARVATGGWQRFQGATRCEQTGNTLVCDNGYRQTTR